MSYSTFITPVQMEFIEKEFLFKALIKKLMALDKAQQGLIISHLFSASDYLNDQEAQEAEIFELLVKICTIDLDEYFAPILKTIAHEKLV